MFKLITGDLFIFSIKELSNIFQLIHYTHYVAKSFIIETLKENE